MEDIETFVARLLNDISALPEERMRVDLLARRLKELSPEDAALSIDLVYKKSPEDCLARRARSVFVHHDSIKSALGEQAYELICLASVRLGLKRVERLFTELKPRKSGLSGYDKEEEAKMEFITLGQRRSLSKRPVKDSIDRLLSDPDPLVITNLLNNPRITEKEVLKIASKRPNSPRILKLIIGHRVWSKRYAVVKAVTLNPYTPPRVSISLLEFLLTQDLKTVAEDKTIHPEVKTSAGEILERRGLKAEA